MTSDEHQTSTMSQTAAEEHGPRGVERPISPAGDSVQSEPRSASRGGGEQLLGFFGWDDFGKSAVNGILSIAWSWGGDKLKSLVFGEDPTLAKLKEVQDAIERLRGQVEQLNQRTEEMLHELVAGNHEILAELSKATIKRSTNVIAHNYEQYEFAKRSDSVGSDEIRRFADTMLSGTEDIGYHLSAIHAGIVNSPHGLGVLERTTNELIARGENYGLEHQYVVLRTYFLYLLSVQGQGKTLICEALVLRETESKPAPTTVGYFLGDVEDLMKQHQERLLEQFQFFSMCVDKLIVAKANTKTDLIVRAGLYSDLLLSEISKVLRDADLMGVLLISGSTHAGIHSTYMHPRRVTAYLIGDPQRIEHYLKTSAIMCEGEAMFPVDALGRGGPETNRSEESGVGEQNVQLISSFSTSPYLEWLAEEKSETPASAFKGWKLIDSNSKGLRKMVAATPNGAFRVSRTLSVVRLCREVALDQHGAEHAVSLQGRRLAKTTMQSLTEQIQEAAHRLGPRRKEYGDPKEYLITPEAQPVIHHIPDNDVLKNHTG